MAQQGDEMTKAPAKKATKPAAKATKKAAPTKVAPKKAASSPDMERTFMMSPEVKDWIERAQSIMNHQRGEIERLKTENTELKAYKRWAEHRILRSDHE
jgi:hypothetical protein